MRASIFSTSAEYALCALIHLARRGVTNTQDLSTETNIPPPYLSKILGALARAGIVKGARGLHGGFRLVRRPNEIRLLEIIETFDGPQAQERCLRQGEHSCPYAAVCGVNDVWEGLRRAFMNSLSDLTLEELLRTYASNPP